MENHHVIKTIRERRSARKFQNKKISFDKIALLVEAGSKAPSAGNLQDYRFIIVDDKEKIKVLAEHCNEQHWIATAPQLIVVCSDTARTEAYYGLRGQRLYSTQSAAAATQNILLMAKALGLGACWIGSFNEDFVSDEFGIPEKVRPQAIIAIGYPEGFFGALKKLDLDLVREITYPDHYELKPEEFELIEKQLLAKGIHDLVITHKDFYHLPSQKPELNIFIMKIGIDFDAENEFLQDIRERLSQKK